MLKNLVIGQGMLVIILASSVAFCQQSAEPPAPTPGIEFPVVMKENVTAGKTAVRTKIEAKLLVATLVNGVVIPKGSILSGEVVESVAKSATVLSRLAIRVDSAQSKNGSIPIKVYLTAWYYPTATMTPQNLSYDPADATHSPRSWNGDGPYYDPKSPAYQPLPGHETDKGGGAPSRASNRRVLMKNVECSRASDGTVVITSGHHNLKIDKLTTYVLAPSDLLPANK
jgi:hypothetical protein